MEWFIHRTLQKLPGAFELAFWNVLLPQATVSEPAVLHAVLSLSSVHWRQALDIERTSGSSKDATTEVFALQQYNSAINDLRCRMKDKSKLSTKVALITCAIFIQLEYLRGFYQTALTHLRHGLIMLEEMLYTNEKAEDHSRDVVSEWIMQNFTTMIVQAKLFGQDVCQPRLLFLLRKRTRSMNEIFQSLGHARQSLEGVFFQIMGLKSEDERYTEAVLDDQSPLSEFTCMDRQASIQTELDIWLRACESAIYESKKTDVHSAASAVDRFAWRLLKVYHTLAQVMAVECFSSDTPAATSLTCLFDSIIAECEVLFKWAFSPSIQTARLHRPPADRDASHAIADIGWIPPIYYAAMRCRDLRIRNKAIEMLRLVPHREGIWDSLMAATIADKALAIERDLNGTLAENSCVQDIASNLESEKCRMKDVRVELPEGSKGALELSYSASRDRDNGWILERQTYDLRSSRWD